MYLSTPLEVEVLVPPLYDGRRVSKASKKCFSASNICPIVIGRVSDSVADDGGQGDSEEDCGADSAASVDVVPSKESDGGINPADRVTESVVSNVINKSSKVLCFIYVLPNGPLR